MVRYLLVIHIPGLGTAQGLVLWEMLPAVGLVLRLGEEYLEAQCLQLVGMCPAVQGQVSWEMLPAVGLQ